MLAVVVIANTVLKSKTHNMHPSFVVCDKEDHDPC